ncbi:diguanylate cyclase domain-containing protein [Shewanella aestuarii]|uniref:diguanylate cyclase n=1 Tax=Shewanella aestuarii TaxID=1028752 RepID=A0A6G9QJQ9_9GAMM|nr:diguanylate cyclase [Shewanella aestuarii]QIR14804.1 diguanylate cyclase [Shewanella aestuarii]
MDISDLLISQREVKGKILIVDDQIINIKILRQLLHDDYDIHMAKDGHQALEMCSSVKPDLVLLDIEMPTLNGFEVCRELKNNPKTTDIAVIFITGHFDEEKEVQGFQLGAVDFIHKPINPIITKARVKNQFMLKRQNDLLLKFALYDGLTGIANRRHFEQRFSENWRLCAREQKPISLIMLDIDQFKQYNDHYGHQQGDDCLLKVAKALSDTVNRPFDLVARYGGEEFICILPNTTFIGAQHIAQKIIANVQAINIQHEYSNVAKHVTISAGVATTIPEQEHLHDLLIELADKQLYIAKKQGRNQVAAFEVTNISID